MNASTAASLLASRIHRKMEYCFSGICPVFLLLRSMYHDLLDTADTSCLSCSQCTLWFITVCLVSYRYHNIPGTIELLATSS